MKCSLSPILLFLCAAVILFSCKKTHEMTSGHPTSSGDSTTSTTQIDYIYLASSFQENVAGVRQIELILNDQSGNILLDTIAAVNTNIVANLKTTSKTVDMTVISYQKEINDYYIYTNRGINPTAWTFLPGSDSLLGTPPASATSSGLQQANVDYTNVPSGQGEPYYWTTSDTYDSGYVNAGQPNLSIPFRWSQGSYAYLLFPDLALYNLHRIGSAADTVDLSNPGTAEKVTFARGPYAQLNGQLYGYPDTTNLGTVLMLAQFAPAFAQPGLILYLVPGADLAYPGNQSFQKYNVGLNFSNNNITASYGDPWCDSVNPNPILLDSSYYTISSSTNNNFSVQFNKPAPGFYTLLYEGNGFSWGVNVPSDSTVIHPVSYLASLKSKMLATQNLNSIYSSAFRFSYNISENQLVPTSIPLGLTNYQAPPHHTPSVTLTVGLQE
jgi:hypothetical protein